MGCDIHLFVEIKDQTNKWKVIKDINYIDLNQAKQDLNNYANEEPNVYYLNELHNRVKLAETPSYQFLYNSRNYFLFNMLANVRNGYTAGNNYYTITPISEIKGIPNDISCTLKKYFNKWNTIGHSYSYLTLEELDTNYWNETECLYGYVYPLNFKKYLKTGKPNYYITGNITKNVISNEEMTKYVNSNEYDSFNKDLYTIISWKIQRYQLANDFYNNAMPYLRTLGKKYKKNNVRIVYFFDN